MSRPKPQVLLSHTDNTTYKMEQVLDATGIYAVYYLGRAINLRTMNSLVSYPGPKYRKVSFSNPGHAFNLCGKLNKLFNTDKFSVVLLTQGVIISEDSAQ